MATSRAVNPVQNVVRHTHDAIVLGAAKMVADAIRLSMRDLPPIVTTLSQALDLRRMPRERLFRTNVDIAEQAHRSVVRGWRTRLPAHTGPSGRKRLSGHLERAIADPGNTGATTDRVISFVDTELMDREAKHWYRINYGAAGSRYPESRPQARFTMQLNNSTLASFMDESPPDPKSWIPRLQRGPDGERRWVAVPSPYGARAARFLDLGHATVARKAPQAYENLWRNYLNEGGQTVRSRLKKVDINVTGDLRLQRNSWSARVRRS